MKNRQELSVKATSNREIEDKAESGECISVVDISKEKGNNVNDLSEYSPTEEALPKDEDDKVHARSEDQNDSDIDRDDNQAKYTLHLLIQVTS